MECACVYVDVYSSYPDFFEERNRKAVKQHKCSECNRTIETGEIYNYIVGKWEGYFDIFKMCDDCCSIRKSFFCEGFSFGGMIEELYNHIESLNGDISSDCIKPLTKKAREMVCEMIERQWNDYED